MDRYFGFILAVLGCLALASGIQAAHTSTTRAKTCTDKFAAQPGHTFCLANRTQHPVHAAERKLILDLHNEIRNSVKPPAADMLKMHYSMMLEEEAQIWAENCVYKHDSGHRSIPGGYSVGQNIAMTSRSGNQWAKMIGLWEADKTKYHFHYGDGVSRSSHYTQQIWASTTLIGCGMAHCSQGYMYVCNYGPAGNIGDKSRPYKEATSGHGGEDCPHKKESNSTLCDCNSAVCNNRGTLDPDTCTCHCSSGPDYSDDKCSLSCAPNSDRSMCGTRVYVKENCVKYQNVPVDCPWLCGLCPYVGPNYVEGSEPLPTGSSANIG